MCHVIHIFTFVRILEVINDPYPTNYYFFIWYWPKYCDACCGHVATVEAETVRATHFYCSKGHFFAAHHNKNMPTKLLQVTDI